MEENGKWNESMKRIIRMTFGFVYEGNVHDMKEDKWARHLDFIKLLNLRM